MGERNARHVQGKGSSSHLPLALFQPLYVGHATEERQLACEAVA